MTQPERRICPASKQGRLLAVFVRGAWLDRFAAEKIGDHVLPTSVSLLQRRFGLSFDRRRVTKAGAYGTFSCVEYSLPFESRARARQLLAER